MQHKYNHKYIKIEKIQQELFNKKKLITSNIEFTELSSDPNYLQLDKTI
jgi:hypothetical protein